MPLVISTARPAAPGPPGASAPPRAPLPPSSAQLPRAQGPLARVDAHVELDRREDAAVLLVELADALPDRERGARRVERVVGDAALAVRLEDHHQAVAG